jgi:hypothetical protein
VRKSRYFRASAAASTSAGGFGSRASTSEENGIELMKWSAS